MKTISKIKTGFLSFMFIVITTLISFGNRTGGYQNPDIRNLEPFTAIESNIDVDITLIQSTSSSLRIMASQIVSSAIKTVVEDGTLKITMGKNVVKGGDHPFIQIYCPSLLKIKIDGSGSINSKGQIYIKSGFEINNTGAANINLDINAPSSVVISKNTGSGNLILSGFAKNHQATIDETASIDAEALSTDFTLIINNGAGEAKVSTNKSIEIVINGNGNVYYRAKETKINQVIFGNGQAIRL